MKKMILIMGLLALAVLAVSCAREGAVAGEATKLTGTRAGELQRVCPSGCDLDKRISTSESTIIDLKAKVTTLENDIIELKAQLADLRGETSLVRSENYTACLAEQTGCGTESISLTPFGGCPVGVTASACNADGSLRCTGEGEFYINGPVDICTTSRSCTGDAPYARC